MLLAIDIGNSDIVFGVHNVMSWTNIFRKSSSPPLQASDYEANLRLRFLENNLKISDITQVVISSVVPGLTGIVQQTSQHLFGLKPIMVEPSIYTALGLDVISPYEIGTDLVSNAVYAFHTYHQNCIIVDFGTALTFTVVSSMGKIEGVTIAPGLKTAVKSLFSNTAQLPEVPLQMPESAIGKNTVHAIQAGILWGYVGLVETILEKIKGEIPSCKVLATGGLSSILTPLQKHFDEVDVYLTLNGLRLIAQLISEKKGA